MIGIFIKHNSFKIENWGLSGSISFFYIIFLNWKLRIIVIYFVFFVRPVRFEVVELATSHLQSCFKLVIGIFIIHNSFKIENWELSWSISFFCATGSFWSRRIGNAARPIFFPNIIRTATLAVSYWMACGDIQFLRVYIMMIFFRSHIQFDSTWNQ